MPYYGFAHRTVKWWKRVCFHLLDLSIVNAHILYNATADNKVTQLEFRIAVAKGLLEDFEHHTCRLSAITADHLRLTERAFPVPIRNHAWPDC